MIDRILPMSKDKESFRGGVELVLLGENVDQVVEVVTLGRLGVGAKKVGAWALNKFMRGVARFMGEKEMIDMIDMAEVSKLDDREIRRKLREKIREYEKEKGREKEGSPWVPRILNAIRSLPVFPEPEEIEAAISRTGRLTTAGVIGLILLALASSGSWLAALGASVVGAKILAMVMNGLVFSWMDIASGDIEAYPGQKKPEWATY